MALDDGRPWVSAFRASLGADAPPVRMRICTRFRPTEAKTGDGLPGYRGYPAAFFLRLFATAPLMLFSRAVGTLP
jgi:hypothetical protein